MEIDAIFSWYQDKIGTYDKQKWETKIEQRAHRIYGLNHIQTRSTKPNTDLIDLDLVRGSSFTKAKPKHGFIEVTKLATLRCLFLPFFRKWWMKQTSKYIFIVGLVVYSLLITNICIYFWFSTPSKENVETVEFKEVLIPFLMMWVLSLIHSQIVATSPVTERQSPQTKLKHFKKRRYNKKKQIAANKNSEVLDLKVNKVEQINNANKDKVDKTKLEAPSAHLSTDSESEENTFKQKIKLSNHKTKVKLPSINITSQDSNLDTEEELPSSPETKIAGPLTVELTSATEWMGVTTNSEDCSYSSDLDDITDSNVEKDDCSVYDNELAPTAILNPPFGKVTCLIWDRKNEVRKAELSMLEISSVIIGKVESKPDSMDYFYVGIFFSTVLAFLPVICRIISTELTFSEAQHFIDDLYMNITFIETKTDENSTVLSFYREVFSEVLSRMANYILSAMNGSTWEYIVLTISLIQRWILASMIFFLLAVAERTFKQRLLYAKLFSHLTSSRRAHKSELPHFRLNKVLNIKTWLSVRSYLKKRGPQRSVDVIVSTAFVANLLLLTFLCVEVLKDTVLFTQYYIEALIWCLGLGILLLRFMTLGTKINKKYRNLSVLITEQINLHLQIEQKPQKKEEYNVANNVLKLAIDLLKELENPFKISGISANPILYNVTKLVILSALSGVLSEMLGFKLKLHKIKLK